MKISFNDKNDNDEFTRNIGAFEPIYTAGYIQDKFAFDDLIFSIGLRVIDMMLINLFYQMNIVYMILTQQVQMLNY